MTTETKSPQELLDERGRVAHEMKALHKKVETEKNGVWSEEDNQRWAQLSDQSSILKERADKAAQVSELLNSLDESFNDPHRPALTQQGAIHQSRQSDVLSAYGRALLHGLKDFVPTPNQVFTDVDRRVLKNALSQSDSSQGGYLSPPMEFVQQLIQNIDDMVFLRSWATVHTVTNSDSLGVPSLDNDPADADWTTEIATGSEDSTMDFGSREFKPQPIAKRIKVSDKLLRTSAMPVEQLVLQRLGYKFGITEEKAFLTGTGASQPLGLFTASNDGIPTSRDERGSNTTTAIVAASLLDAKYKLKQQYWVNSRWLFHRDAMKMIAKLVDGDGQFLFRESARAGEPDTLVGRPFFMSEYAPNTFTANKYVGLLGDFSHYWIVDSLMMRIKRLDELYAETDQVGFIGRKETDAMPVLSEAFVRLQLAAS